MARLTIKDKEKPYILIGAVIVGIIIQKLIGKEIPWLIYFTEVGIFFVIFAIMLALKIKDIGKVFKKVKPTGIALFMNFIFIPAFSWTMGYIFLRQYPDFWVGAILYTLTPCIGWYLIFTNIAEGDVVWGVALLPWNITLQVVLMPVYLYILIGKVIPIDLSAMVRSVTLFLFLPFVLGYIVQKQIIKKRGREYFFGTFKSHLGEVKLWALVVVIISMFVSQASLKLSDIHKVGILILFLVAFFFILFLIALFIGKIFNLGYADTVTMAFTTTARNSEVVIGVAIAPFSMVLPQDLQ